MGSAWGFEGGVVSVLFLLFVLREFEEVGGVELGGGKVGMLVLDPGLYFFMDRVLGRFLFHEGRDLFLE